MSKVMEVVFKDGIIRVDEETGMTSLNDLVDIINIVRENNGLSKIRSSDCFENKVVDKFTTELGSRYILDACDLKVSKRGRYSGNTLVHPFVLMKIAEKNNLNALELYNALLDKCGDYIFYGCCGEVLDYEDYCALSSILNINNNKSTLVYCLSVPRSSDYVCKIGIANDINKRVKQLQTGCWYEIEVDWVIECEDPKALEKHLHKTFARFREVGEWFSELDGKTVYKEAMKFLNKK